MTPGARAAAAIAVLDEWERTGERAEPLLRRWGKENRFAGSGDRRAIADIVYDCLRRRRSLAARSGAAGGRAMVHGLALAEGWPAEEIFSGARHMPAPLSEAERNAAPGAAPDPVRFDHPDWLEDELKASLGARYEAAMTALSHRAPVDLRVNRLKSDRESVRAELASGGVEAEALATPDALRCPPGARIAQSRVLTEGWAELQDEASQAGAALAGAQPGETVLDYCAGGGGKALAFASHMGGRGRVVAHDVEPRRMRDLPARAARAGAAIEIAEGRALAKLEGACDLVFVDAPCSGAGTWRRDPEAKWRLTPEILAARRRDQRAAFAAALRYLAPGGRIAYATCSLLASENEAQVAAFVREFGLRELRRLRRTPDEEADGFFCAVLRSG